MYFEKKVFTVEELLKLNGDGKLNLSPKYQRDDAWDGKRRQKFVLSILQGYDIPKVYLRETATQFEVVDGKQRLTTLTNYLNDLFDLPRGIALIRGYDVSKKSYSELPEELREVIGQFKIDATIYADITELDTEEIFARLQLGAALNAQEKRNASSTPLSDFIRDITGFLFFTDKIPLENKRYVHNQIAYQTLAIFEAGIPMNINSGALDRFTSLHRELTHGEEAADQYKLVLTDFSKQFANQSSSLARYNLVPLFLLAKKLLEEGSYTDYVVHIGDWLNEFQSKKEEEQTLADSRKNAKWRNYLRALYHHTDTAESIRVRADWMYKDFMDYANSLKDDPMFNTPPKV